MTFDLNLRDQSSLDRPLRAPGVSIVVPMYNEQASVDELLQDGVSGRVAAPGKSLSGGEKARRCCCQTPQKSLARLGQKFGRRAL